MILGLSKGCRGAPFIFLLFLFQTSFLFFVHIENLAKFAGYDCSYSLSLFNIHKINRK